MQVTIDNLPIVFLVMVGVGMLIVLIGVLRLASEQDHNTSYTNLDSYGQAGQLEELFSFFLQEEEKKNQNFREMVMSATNQKENKQVLSNDIKEPAVPNIQSKKKKTKPIEEATFQDIISRYEAGQDIESIARDLKKGTGEVKLIISLYAMR